MARLDRDAWIRGALALLTTGGIADVKVEPLAASLGVTKGSFYWHFDDRAALLQAMLETWVAQGTEGIIDLVADGVGPDPTVDPATALRRLTQLTLGPPDEHDATETAIRAWAATEPAVAATVAAVDERRLAYVTDLLVAAGIEPPVARGRAHALYRVIIGEYLWRRYGGTNLEAEAVADLVDLILTP